MEEYFSPIGTDHQILEGKEAGFSLNRFAILLGGAFLVLIVTLITFSVWQRRVSFSIPDTELSATLSKKAQIELKDGSLVDLPSGWKTAIPKSSSAIVTGGDAQRLTWMLAPLWVKTPSGFKTIERHGLYRLSGLDEQALSSTYSLSMHAAAAWMTPLKHALGAFRVRIPSLSPDPVFFAWDKHLIKSSLPFSATGTLSDQDDVSYALQQNTFDSEFLHSVQLNRQGLSPWRKELTRVSWTGAPSARSWELVFASASSSAIPLLSANASNTYSEPLMLRDGSGTRVYKTSSLVSSTTIRIGTAPATSSVVCQQKTFVPFLRIRGEALAAPLPVFPFFRPSALRVFEVGSLDQTLSVCFE